MGLVAAVHFGNESSADLLAMGWFVNNTTDPFYFTPINDTTKVWTYSGTASVKWGLGMANGAQLYPMNSLQPASHKGCWSAALWFANVGPVVAAVLMQHQGLGYGASTTVVHASVNQLGLYVANTFKGSSGPVQYLGQKVWVTLKSDQSGATWTGELLINGVSQVSGSQAAQAQTSSNFFMGSIIPGPASTQGQVCTGLAYWDDLLDDAETPRRFSESQATANGSNVGDNWSSTEATFHEAVATPWDPTKKATEADPSAGERLNVVTPTIATTLGITPATIEGVTLHVWASGQAVTGKAVLGDGTTEAAGTTTVVDELNPTYLYVTSANSPTGPAWAGTDLLEFSFEIQ
jgi:hypothetical protein